MIYSSVWSAISCTLHTDKSAMCVNAVMNINLWSGTIENNAEAPSSEREPSERYPWWRSSPWCRDRGAGWPGVFRFRSAAPAGRGRSRCRSRRTTPRRRTWRGDPCPRRSSGQTPSCRDRPDPDLRRGAIYRDFSGSSLGFPLRRLMNEINLLECLPSDLELEFRLLVFLWVSFWKRNKYKSQRRWI